MARETTSLYTFNRGMVSRLGMARMDVKRMSMSAELQVNYISRVLGSMSLRPGLEFLNNSANNLTAKFVPFVKATTDVALIEFNAGGNIRFWVNDLPVAFPSVATTVSLITPAMTGWTLASGVTYDGTNYSLDFVSDGTTQKTADQTVSVAAPDQTKEHCIVFMVPWGQGTSHNGPVSLRIGTTLGGDDLVKEAVCDDGWHSFAFTPNASTFYIRFFSTSIATKAISSFILANGTTLSLVSPYGTDVSALGNLRWDQSADVVFLACVGYPQMKVERHGTHSYSIVVYKSPDGPFQLENIDQSLTLTPSGINGNITLTASRALFDTKARTLFLDSTINSGHSGSLFQVVSNGQKVSATLGGISAATGYIRVTGIGAGRNISLTISGLTGTGTHLVLQSSFGVPGAWSNLSGTFVWNGISLTVGDITSDLSNFQYNDGYDNAIVYYRVVVTTYSSGTPLVTISFPNGSITGTVRVLNVVSSTVANCEVVKALGGTGGVTTWSAPQWSWRDGFPSGPSLYEGRLWWGGAGGIWGSISDAFDSFDSSFLGDAGPINRNIGTGPVDAVNWMLPLQRLLVGTAGNEFSVRSTALDEPVTPTNFNIKAVSNQGSSYTPGVKIDQRGIFVCRTGMRAYQLQFSFQFYDYMATDLTALVPEILRPGIVRVAVQRQPDTRIHFVRSDGTVVLCVIDPNEEVAAFCLVQTNGIVEDVVVLPAIASGSDTDDTVPDLDDQVYYLVQRTINGSTVRYLEKWAQETECRGDQQLCMLGDSFVAQTFASPKATITGLDNMEGQQVVVWADGADVGTDDTTTPWTLLYTVTGGQITLAVPATNVVVGLPYTAQFKSSKLGVATADIQSPLNQQKKIQHLGLVLADVHTRGLRFGADFNVMDDMPLIEHGRLVGDAVSSTYDENVIEFPGLWDTDLRVCLQSQAPRPCTVMALTMDLSMHE